MEMLFDSMKNVEGRKFICHDAIETIVNNYYSFEKKKRIKADLPTLSSKFFCQQKL